MRRVCILFCLLAVGSGCATTPPPCNCPPPAQPLPAPPAVERPEPVDLGKLFESVVQIKVKVGERMQNGRLEESYEYGTGFFVNERGLILTSAHVLAAVSDPRAITVLHAGRPLQARPVRVHREVDLATLLVDAGRTTPLRLSRRSPRLGEPVYAVGYPYVDIFRDDRPAVSAGHVAGTDRRILYAGEPVERLVLTDAFVADGCSGGPLIDERGEVIGVLRFNLSRKGSWLGLSFAEPVSSYLDRRGEGR